MSDTFVCRIGEVPAGGLLEVTVAGGEPLCVARDGDQWWACQGRCPHQGQPLCNAHLEGGVLTCLEHLWQWDLRAGGMAIGLAEEGLKMVAITRLGDELHRQAS